MKKIYLGILAALFFPLFAFANPNSVVEKRWNAKSNEWTLSKRLDYTYSTKFPSKVSEEINSFWNSYKDEWAQSQKTVYAYDAQGNLTSSTLYNFYGPSSSWVPVSKSEYSYTKDKTTRTDYKYNNYVGKETDWNIDKKYETATSKDKKLTEVGYRWNAKTETWTLCEKRSFKYDTSGLLASESVELISEKGETYETQNIKYTYGLNNYITEKVVEDQHAGNCDHGGKFIYEYN